MALSTSTDSLAVGASRTFNLSPGSALTLVAPPNVRATVTETPNTVSASGVGGNASRVHNLQLAQTVTYGPYPMGGTVVVANASNSGTAITWVRSDSIVAESASGAVSLVDGAGNVQLLELAGVAQTVCIGDSFTAQNQANSMAISAATRLNNVVTATVASNSLGDGVYITTINMVPADFCVNKVQFTRIDATTITYPSIGPDGSASNLSGSLKPMLALNLQSASEAGYFYWLNGISGGAFSMLHNAGANGQTAADMRARFERDVLAFKTADHIIFNCGYNDFVQESRTAQAVYDDVVAMISACGQRAVTVIGAQPWTTGGTTANRAQAVIYNRMIANYCASKPNARYADAVKYLVDATAATRFSPLAGMLQSDGIHPTPRGARAIAQAIWDVNQTRVAVPSRLVTSNADNVGYDSGSKNIVDNAPWVTTGGGLGGGATGTAASGWGVTNGGSGTSVASVVARADGCGYLQRAVFTPAANNDSVVVSVQGAISGRISAGQKIRVICQMVLSGLSGANIKSIEIRLGFNNSPATSAHVAAAMSGATASLSMNTDGTYTLVSPDITVPVGATTVTFQTTTTAGAAGTALTISVGALSIEIVG